MACECVLIVQQNLLKARRESHQERIYEDLITWKTGFENITFAGNLYFTFKASYTFTKKNGAPSTAKIDKAHVMPAFCPFCGKKIDERKEDVG